MDENLSVMTIEQLFFEQIKMVTRRSQQRPTPLVSTKQMRTPAAIYVLHN
ncbi:MAG: hypothetical protein QXK37_02540 [Candidatus Woesearchaeota archaeon]